MKHFYSLFIAVLTLIGTSFSVEVFGQGNTCAEAIPLAVHINSCQNTAVSNVGLSNSGVFPTGESCTGYNGGDLWLSVVIPPSGEVTVRVSAIQGTTNLNSDFNMAAWSGDCGSLVQEGCDEDSNGGFFPAVVLTGTPGETQYVQVWETANNAPSIFNVCAEGTPTCTSPVATFTPECGAENQYNINVNITSLGDATEVSIINDGGAASINGITATGTYQIGPFSLDQEVNVTVVHGGNTDCNVSKVVTDVGLGCDHVITCGNDLTQTYCYKNFDYTEFRYSSPDGSPITLTFNSGLIQTPEDNFYVYNGTTTSSPLLYYGNNGGDLTGFTRTASSGHIMIRMYTDGGGSCADNSLGLGGGWNWTISCAVLTPCENAAQVVSQPTFAASEVSADLNGVTFSGANECQGPGTNPDLYFKFTAVSSLQYIRATGSGDFDPAIEVFASCGGAQLACANDAGPGENEEVAVTGLTPGQEYVYRVYHAGAAVATTTTFETGVRHTDVPVVHLRNDFCGILDYTPNDIVRSVTANPNVNINRYIWEFTELEPPFNVYTVNSPNGSNPQFRMFWFTNFEYGRTYDVRIKVQLNGGAEGEYGAGCTIGFAAEPISSLQPQYENGFYELCDIIKAVKVNGSTNYRWTFDDGTNVLEYNSNSGNYFCPLQNVSGLELGTSYQVNVYVTGGGVESTTSVERTINMNGFVSNTSLNPFFLACGSTVNLTQSTQAFNVCAATGYTFRFENLSQPALPVIEVVRPNRVIIFSWVPGLIPGDTYSVAVKASAGGLTGDYSSTCEITIAVPTVGLASEGMQVASGPIVEPETQIEPELAVSPNPVSNGSDISVVITDLASTEQSVEVRVFDLAGRIVFNQQFGNQGGTFRTRIQLDSGLPTGIYILQSVVNGKLQGTEKLIVE